MSFFPNGNQCEKLTLFLRVLLTFPVPFLWIWTSYTFLFHSRRNRNFTSALTNQFALIISIPDLYQVLTGYGKWKSNRSIMQLFLDLNPFYHKDLTSLTSMNMHSYLQELPSSNDQWPLLTVTEACNQRGTRNAFENFLSATFKAVTQVLLTCFFLRAHEESCL